MQMLFSKLLEWSTYVQELSATEKSTKLVINSGVYPYRSWKKEEWELDAWSQLMQNSRALLRITALRQHL